MTLEETYKKFEEEAKYWLDELEKYNDIPFVEQSPNDQWTLSKLYAYLSSICIDFYSEKISSAIKNQDNGKGSKTMAGFLVSLSNSIPNYAIKEFNKTFEFENDIQKVSEAKSKILLSMKSMLKLANDIQKDNAKKKIKHPVFGWLTLKQWYSLPQLHFKAGREIKDDIETYIISRKGIK